MSEQEENDDAPIAYTLTGIEARVTRILAKYLNTTPDMAACVIFGAGFGACTKQMRDRSLYAELRETMCQEAGSGRMTLDTWKTIEGMLGSLKGR